ncbi:MAG: TolC family protein [Bacteroidales bacterium]|nr:TolC family protein [Bacteroidales bacterium]
MRKILFIILVFYISIVNAQNAYQTILDQVEANSPFLSSLKMQVEADKAENYTGPLMADPELAAGYHWGINGNDQRRIALEISQEIVFPTVYSNKNKVNKISDDVSDAEFEVQRNEFLFEVQLLCNDLVYNKIKIEENKHCLRCAEMTRESYKNKLDTGEATIIDYKKAQLAYIDHKNEHDLLILEKDALIGRLKVLNGGIDIDFEQDTYANLPLPADFEEWYKNVEANNPVFVHLEKENALNQRLVKLQKSEWIPSLKIGYLIEDETDGGYQGPQIGLSLPLWSNSNLVKSAKLRAKSSETMLENQRVMLKNELYNTYLRAKRLQENYATMSSMMSEADGVELLQKLLDKGEMTLFDFLIETEYQHQISLKVIDIQYELQKALLELHRYSM